MDVSILIISYNTRELTLACLESVYAQTSGISFEVIVADNASADGSADAIAEKFPQAKLVRLEKNIGEYLLLLNPDTVILDGAVQKVLAHAKTKNPGGIVGGRTYFADRSLNYSSCHGKPPPWSMFCMASGLTSLLRRSAIFAPEALGAWKRDTVRQVDAVTGCFLLLPREL